MKFCAVINSASGNHEGARWKEILERTHCGKIFELRDVNPVELREFAANMEVVVIGGGDGTVSFVATTLLGLSCKLAVLPLGTGNDLARELKIYKSALSSYHSENFKDFLELPSKPVSVWKITGEKLGEKLFVNYFSIGLDGLIIHLFHTARHVKQSSVLKNRLQYGWHLLRNFSHRVSGITLKTQSQVMELPQTFSSLTFCNIPFAAGFGSFRSSINSSDVLLDAMVFRSVLDYVPIFAPVHDNLKPRILGSSSVWSVQNIPGDAYLQVDGETLKLAGEREIGVEYAGEMSFLCNK